MKIRKSFGQYFSSKIKQHNQQLSIGIGFKYNFSAIRLISLGIGEEITVKK